MPIDDLTALGQRMREARKKKDLTQQELSDLSHVSVKQIANIEKGKMNPSYLILRALAKVLHISLDTLINPDQVYGVFELLVILTDFHSVDELNEGGEVLFLHRSLIMDIANKRAVQQGFCFYPEIVSGLAFAFGVGDQRCYQLQDVLFAMDIGERVIVHGLLEVDGI